MNARYRSRVIVSAIAVASVVAAFVFGGCDDSPTTALVENGYPIPSDAGTGGSTMTVFKAWWVTTLFRTPVAPGEVSETERTIPASDFAYALLAPDWSSAGASSPGRLIAIKSKQKLSVAARDLLRITVSDDQFIGNCAAGVALGADDARFIVERIFPGDFASVAYDPETCTSIPVIVDGGAP